MICALYYIYSKAAADTKHGQLSRGCKCKRTKCLKKYCECFQANALCSDNCKCINCENVSALGATNNTPDSLICAPQSSLQVYRRRRRYRELLPEASELYSTSFRKYALLILIIILSGIAVEFVSSSFKFDA